MTIEILLIAVAILLIACAIELAFLLKRLPANDWLRIEKLIRTSEQSMEAAVKDENYRNREELRATSRQAREEMSGILRNFGDSNITGMTHISSLQKDQFDSFSKQLLGLTQVTEERLERVRTTLEQKLKELQEDNGKRLEQMREVVDEKLHDSLNRRLGESFNLVVERLELVHRGLGEMQSLATGVGDLRRILGNVRTRGTSAEWQLGSLLEDLLAPSQFEKNVATRKGSNDKVEFALRLPGQDIHQREVLLPIDAKFPIEDYGRLVEAQEQANLGQVEEAAKNLERRIKEMAKSIRDKYLDPPHTTDFGIMYLPTEGLFAEVIRRPNLCEVLQRDYRVMITGPTTLGTLLNCLQVGFRTLAIAKRSSEVWELLGAVKSEFGRFGQLLDKTKKKLEEATNTIEDAARKSRTIERKLKEVQDLPGEEMAHTATEIEQLSIQPALMLAADVRESNDN